MHVISDLGSDATDGCLHHIHIQAWQRQSAELFASEIPSRLESMLSGVERCTMGDVQGKHDS